MIQLNNQDDIYKALIKINQIGKKLSYSGKYILNNGIMLSYQKQEMSDVEANPVSVGFVENKFIEKLNSIDTIGLIIDGIELYKLSQEYEFDNISLDKEGVSINFIYYAIDDKQYIDNFKQLLRNKGFKDNDIEIASVSNYTSNIDMYDLYLDYKKRVEPTKSKFFKSIKLYFAKTDNFMYKKSNKIINELLYSNLLYYEDIKQEILELIVASNQPVIRILHTDNNESISIRLMKSVFNPIAAKNSASIYITEKDDNRYMITKINCTAVTVFNIFKIAKY